MFRYPMGGMMSWLLQYLVGFARLGHEVWYVERAARPNDWFDPVQDAMTDDASHGARVVGDLLARHGYGERWHLQDLAGRSFGASRGQIESAFASADLFVDMGGDHSWLDDASRCGLRILIDCEPGFTQMKMASRLEAGETLPDYDAWFTPGRNVGTERSSVPTAGKAWRAIVDPVVPGLFPVEPARRDAPFTTVMSWQSMRPRVWQGRSYGNKDVEFERFEQLPRMTRVPLEVAVSGRDVPWQRLARNGWRTRDANRISTSFESYAAYVRSARGEFTVAKHCFVATNCGWFGDRAAVFLASGRPVVMQDTGWSEHLPCGEGLFAVRSAEQAAAALEEIERDFPRHARRAREIAEEHLDAERALRGLLEGLGIA
jgi:hypothetical protein